MTTTATEKPASSTITFFGKVDRNRHGGISSQHPAWTFDTIVETGDDTDDSYVETGSSSDDSIIEGGL